jgi:hypothetical protein
MWGASLPPPAVACYPAGWRRDRSRRPAAKLDRHDRSDHRHGNDRDRNDRHGRDGVLRHNWFQGHDIDHDDHRRWQLRDERVRVLDKLLEQRR